jgi:hypothetical protein
MLDSLWAWVQANPRLAIGGGGIVAFGLYAIYVYWGAIKPKLPAFLGGSTTVTTPTTGTIPTRRQVLDYLDASYAYFASVGCKEGMEACGSAVSHAFHEHPQTQATSTTDAVNQIVNAIGTALKPQPTTLAPTVVTVNTAPETHQ